MECASEWTHLAVLRGRGVSRASGRSLHSRPAVCRLRADSQHDSGLRSAELPTWRPSYKSSNKKLLETSATLVVTGALLVVTRSY